MKKNNFKTDFKTELPRVNKTKTLAELLNMTKFSDNNVSKSIDLSIKKATIFSFWADVVGKKFDGITKPFAIKGSKLFVSAKSPAIIQELTLYKSSIIKKINAYSMPLGFEINEIVFDYKNFKMDENPDEGLIEDKPEFLSDEALNEIEVDEKVIEKTKEAISKLTFIDDNLKQKLLDNAIIAYKAQIVRAKARK